jgi:hypothetical protein
MLEDLIALVQAAPTIIPPIVRIVKAFLRHPDPVKEAERAAALAEANAELVAPFSDPKFTGTKPRP